MNKNLNLMLISILIILFVVISCGDDGNVNTGEMDKYYYRWRMVITYKYTETGHICGKSNPYIYYDNLVDFIMMWQDTTGTKYEITDSVTAKKMFDDLKKYKDYPVEEFNYTTDENCFLNTIITIRCDSLYKERVLSNQSN